MDNAIMNLIALNGSLFGFHASYRGTARIQPFHFDDLPDDCDANQLFFWYTDICDLNGVCHDRNALDQLYKLVTVYNELGKTSHFEIVETVCSDVKPILGNVFLGVDLSLNAVGYSLLENWESSDHSNSNPNQRLSNLIHRYYNRHLNENKLFPDYKLADEFITYVNSLQELSPGTFEYGAFVPTGIYLVQR